MDNLVRNDRQWQTPAHGDPLAAILELRARVEALEAARRPASKVHKISEPLQLTPEQAQQVRDLLAPNSKSTPNLSQIRSSLQLTPEQETEIAALLRPEPFDEEENDRRFKATMAAIDNATPEQIRAAAELPERNSLVERVAGAIADSEDPHELWYDDARAAIREVAAWVREGDPFSCDINGMAAALEQEAER